MPAIGDLSAELRVLHKALLTAGRGAYEAEHGPVQGPTQLLHLLVHDPAFAWLRPLSELMADLDEMLDLGEPLGDEEQRAVRGELEHLFSPAGADLWTSLTTFMQREPEVATAYARIRQLLLALPAPAPIDEAAALHAKHRWAEVRRHRGARGTTT
jgi:hypothetical protein